MAEMQFFWGARYLVAIVDAVAEWSEAIEEAMFAPTRRPAQTTLQAIFSLKRDLLGIGKVTAPSREVLNVLLRREHTLFGDELVPYFQDVYDHPVRVIDGLDTYRDLLAPALDTYGISRTVKTMTAVTAMVMVDPPRVSPRRVAIWVSTRWGRP